MENMDGDGKAKKRRRRRALTEAPKPPSNSIKSYDKTLAEQRAEGLGRDGFHEPSDGFVRAAREAYEELKRDALDEHIAKNARLRKEDLQAREKAAVGNDSSIRQESEATDMEPPKKRWKKFEMPKPKAETPKVPEAQNETPEDLKPRYIRGEAVNDNAAETPKEEPTRAEAADLGKKKEEVPEEEFGNRYADSYAGRLRDRLSFLHTSSSLERAQGKRAQALEELHRQETRLAEIERDLHGEHEARLMEAHGGRPLTESIRRRAAAERAALERERARLISKIEVSKRAVGTHESSVHEKRDAVQKILERAAQRTEASIKPHRDLLAKMIEAEAHAVAKRDHYIRKKDELDDKLASMTADFEAATYGSHRLALKNRLNEAKRVHGALVDQIGIWERTVGRYAHDRLDAERHIRERDAVLEAYVQEHERIVAGKPRRGEAAETFTATVEATPTAAAAPERRAMLERRELNLKEFVDLWNAHHGHSAKLSEADLNVLLPASQYPRDRLRYHDIEAAALLHQELHPPRSFWRLPGLANVRSWWNRRRARRLRSRLTG